MNDKTTREELLEELRRYTGLKIEITEDGQQSEDEVLSVLSMFVRPYKNQDDKAGFFRGLLEQTLSGEAEASGRMRYHLSEDTVFALFLMYFPQGYDEAAGEIIKGLSDGGDVIIEWDDAHLILIKEMRSVVSQARLKEKASEIADTLSADAMIPVLLSFDETKQGISRLGEAYRNAVTAEIFGRQFSSTARISFYRELGLGKLVSRLSEEDCREYISEQLGDFRFDSLDDEMSETIRMFFDTGLSIAETARRLFIHRNTLLYRLEKFEKRSGLDLKKFDDAVAARLAMFMEVVIDS